MCYSLARFKDRRRVRAARQSEIIAIDIGEWPRDLNDRFRWNARPGPEWARKMCVAEILYLDSVELRIAEGDPELKGWEPDPDWRPLPVMDGQKKERA